METYYQKNKATLLAYAKKRYQKNPGYIKNWQANHIEQQRAYKKKYRTKNAEYYINWYKKNGRIRANNYMEKILEWKQTFPTRIKIHRQIARAIKAEEIIRPESCPKCGRMAKIQTHHVDYNHFMNFVWRCSSCHKKEHIKK